MITGLPAFLTKAKGRLQSITLQFALAYGVLFVVSAVVFLSFVWWGTVGLLERQTERSITADAHSIFSTLAVKGHSGVVGLINERLEQDVDDNAVYLLVSSQNEWIAGNLEEWPAIVQRAGRWYTLNVKRIDTENMARVKAFNMPDGDRLLIGRDMSGRSQLSRMLTEGLLWTCVMVSVLAAGGGWVTRRLLRLIIASISKTTQAITQGDMTRRLPVLGLDKEMDEVAHTINEMLDRITRLMDGVKQVSNSIAHDLRTPITRARNQLEEAANQAKSPEELHEAIDQTIRNLDHLTDICAALLRIAQIEAGARRSAFAPFDFIVALRDVIELYDAVIEDQGLTLVHTMPETLPCVGDRAMYQQALANLFDNAIKFSPPNAQITITVKVVPPPTGPKTGPDHMILTIQDQGPGMAPDDMARATERFFRAEQARHTPGAGLGLPLVQAIVQLHGGSLKLSAGNPGLIVTIDTPISTGKH
ncbi:sensor histidine kinase [Acetobacter cibinongensis]|uniref:histidine kinase n=1 Tax=Acetobacter cibinongensis TaxID=146475 RepID=A0A1Z5YS00_9PROT|nr:ATP-binding protein [Acetobacter cibinongensis]OUJ00210.1 hypothetical protein HK14_12440 [Acetobacter cibinongensis]